MKIGVKNFQILENAQVELDGIVLITGRNNSGKTSLYRSMKAFITNQSNEAHIRSGTGAYVIGIQDGEREVVYRKSRRDGNSYIIDKVPHTKLGKKKLSDVLPDFGIREIAVGDGTYAYPNFIPYKQLGFPFNLSDTQIYSIFYKYMGLGEVEGMLSEVQTETKVLKKERNEKEGALVYIQNSITSAEPRMNLFPPEEWYMSWGAWFNTMFLRQDAMIASGDNIQEVSQEIIKVSGRLTTIAFIDELDFDSMVPQQVRIEGLKTQQEGISNAVARETYVVSRIEAIPEIDPADWTLLNDGMIRADGMREAYNNLDIVEHGIFTLTEKMKEETIDCSVELDVVFVIFTQNEALKLIGQDISMNKQSLDLKDTKMKQINDELVKVEKILAEVDACPLCGSKLNG